jgi:hypothetical protein
MPLADEVTKSEVLDLWVNRYTDSMRMTRKLSSVCVLLTVAVVALSILVYRGRHLKPLVLRIDHHGKVITEEYDQAVGQWNETDARADIEDFVRYYYTRDRATIASPEFGFSRSLWYMNSAMEAAESLEMNTVHQGGCQDGSACTVATFEADQTAPEVAVRIASTDF